jgi:ABC-type polysaccharide/polyol phosphate export permease
MLVSQHMYLHDASLLLLPLALCAKRVPNALLATCYLLPAAVFFFAGSPWFFLCAVPILGLLFTVCAAHPEREARDLTLNPAQASSFAAE